MLLVFAAAVLLVAAPARAQVSNLDPNMLIDALADEGMSDLLLHLIETEPPQDPVVAQQIEIAQHRIRYGDESLPREERINALNEAMRSARQLIDEHYEHPQRPIWQTDLAEILLIEYLQAMHDNAQQFYEFGVPTAEQREAYEAAVVEALEAAADADQRFFQLRATLPQEPDHVEKRVNTGLWRRMIDEYYEKRTPFYLAHAAHYTVLLPDDHAYYTGLGQRNPKIPEQRDNAGEERARLIDLAVRRVEPFATDTADAAGVRPAALSLLARALVEQQQYDAAIERADQTISLDPATLEAVEAALAKAKALQRQQQYGAALDVLADLEDHALVQANLLYRLLVVDARHRVLLTQAERQPANTRTGAVASAYDPYMDLLEDPALGEQAEALRNYIYRRWESSLGPDEDVSQRPPLVRLAIAQMARMEGQNLATEADQTGDTSLRQEAAAKLQRAIEVSRTLRGADLPASVRAEALFNEAVAQYWLDPQGVGNLLSVTQLMTDLAAQFPEQPVAETAIANAMILLRPMHQMSPKPPGVDEAYRGAAEVLFEKFPASEAADNERLYYAFTVLQQAGRYAEAAEMYAQVPYTHPDYFEARRERLYALSQVYRQMPEDEDKEAARQRVIEEARALLREAEPAAQTGDRQASAHRAVGGAQLVLADMALAGGDTDEALRLLDGFEQSFEGEPGLIRDALEKRIVALTEAGRVDQAAAEAERMMNAFPDDAAVVIDQVLTRIDEQIEQLRTRIAEELVAARKQALEQQAQDLASAASRLSELLVQWAQGQGYDADQMLPFQLIRAKSLRLAGQAQEAVAYLEPVLQQFPDDAGVMHEYAESLYAVGSDKALVRAASYYDRLITGLGPPYPDLWWNAWMRRLQINDQLGEGTSDIPLRVRQLRLTDPNLGGPRFRETLERLEAKHAL